MTMQEQLLKIWSTVHPTLEPFWTVEPKGEDFEPLSESVEDVEWTKARDLETVVSKNGIRLTMFEVTILRPSLVGVLTPCKVLHYEAYTVGPTTYYSEEGPMSEDYLMEATDFLTDAFLAFYTHDMLATLNK